MSFHPKNHNVICVVGSGFFRMCRLTEGVLKPFGFQKGEHHQAGRNRRFPNYIFIYSFPLFRCCVTTGSAPATLW